MTKTRSFSIYLLKDGCNANNALKGDHDLEDDVKAQSLPEGAKLFVFDGKPYPPWWKDYFGIEKDLNQVSKGALVFLPVGARCFALSHGHVSHNLTDDSYEYDFGLRVTLNCVDPKELKSTDSLEPGVGRRQRTQLPVGSELTLFEFDRDSSILRRLTGKVKEKYKKLLKHVTGASNLRVSSDIPASKLESLCKELLTLYEGDEYKTTFPDIQNIMPVSDPAVVSQLDAKLLEGLQSKSDSLNLTVPELISYNDNVYAKFSGAGVSLRYDDVFIDAYYAYLAQRERDLTSITIDDLKHHCLVLTNEDGSPRDSFSIYKSLVFDATLEGKSEIYHLCEGHWYRVEASYTLRLREFLDPHCIDTVLPPYNHQNEGAYNKAAADTTPKLICLDTTSISPTTQTNVEPCDLYSVSDGFALFFHVKISTLSATLSHLFNQGSNSVELIRVEPEALKRLKALIKEKADADAYDGLVAPLSENKHQVLFVIITHKDKELKSENLPLFSKISLMRNLKALQAMNVPSSFAFVKDETLHTTGAKIKRKKKPKPAEGGGKG